MPATDRAVALTAAGSRPMLRGCFPRSLEFRMLRPLLTALICLVLAPGLARAQFGMGITAGGYSGDRLYSASSATSRQWINPTGDTFGFGDELLVDVEAYAQIGLMAFVPLEEHLGVRVDLAFTDVDIDGKVLNPLGVSETVAWDQWFIVDLIAQATWRFGRSADTYPYVSFGPSVTVASSEGSTLDQFMPGLAYGAGWRISALADGFLDIAVRGQLQWVDFSDEEARLAATEFVGQSTINALSASIGVGRVF